MVNIKASAFDCCVTGDVTGDIAFHAFFFTVCVVVVYLRRYKTTRRMTCFFLFHVENVGRTREKRVKQETNLSVSHASRVMS